MPLIVNGVEVGGGNGYSIADMYVGLNGGKRRTSKALCKKSKSKSKSRGRKSPPYEAFKCVGRIRKGLDGKQWLSKETKNGVIRWVPKK